MGSPGVVVLSPSFDDDLRLSQRVEDFPVQQLGSKPRVEALDIAVLPGASRLDEGRLRADRLDPGPDVLGDELWAVVASDERRGASQDEQVGERVDHVGRVQLPLHLDRQAFPAGLVENVQRPERPAVVSAAMDEVVAPDMVPIRGPEPNA